ncbi:DUF29 domain-containing protein [Stanieria cyanosphaera]|uniref:DUF29 domain-containing protein n=1 Tax=Stanieria cyanosphaera TaxID=102116 RepID=UPI0002D56F35|nr:DUF29 domain-containing protein [Stanieria cyanosphaera]
MTTQISNLSQLYEQDYFLWLEEISNFRFELSQYLDSKTLRNYAEQELETIYARAR